MRLYPFAFVFIVLVAGTFPIRSDQKDKPKDFTNVKPEELGYTAVEPKKDPKTGFVIGGKNATRLIKGLTEINGRAITDLEKDMRPGAKSEVSSGSGFLGKDDRLLDVLAEDNQFVVDKHGLTHQDLAKHMLILAKIGAMLVNQEFLYQGVRF